MLRAIFAALVFTAAVATPVWWDSAGTATVAPPTSGSRAEVRTVDASTAGVASRKQSAAGKYQRTAHKATNARRADHGRKELRKQGCVQRWAVRQAKAMAAKLEMYHQDLGPILKDCGLDVVGENVAYGYPSGRSVVNDGWMNSEGHRANILNPAYRQMGLAAREGDNGLWYVAQVFGTGS